MKVTTYVYVYVIMKTNVWSFVFAFVHMHLRVCIRIQVLQEKTQIATGKYNAKFLQPESASHCASISPIAYDLVYRLRLLFITESVLDSGISLFTIVSLYFLRLVQTDNRTTRSLQFFYNTHSALTCGGFQGGWVWKERNYVTFVQMIMMFSQEIFVAIL